MKPFRIHTGLVAPLRRSNVDTDQIVPKQFLKRVERTGFGEVLFHGWRYRSDGSPDTAFVLNRAPYSSASVLVAGPNFGSGSSREHAVWALMDYGFAAVIAPSFADIFYNNCFKNGLLPVQVEMAVVERIMHLVETKPGYSLKVDLERLAVEDESGPVASFEVDAYRRESLLNGWDDIDLTLRHVEAIARFEQRIG